jgi:hypothetical protein
MATNYPSSKQTFTNPAGTQTLDSPDHAADTTTHYDTTEAVQDTLGTTAGTNIAMDFAAGEFPVKMNASANGTLVETLTGGTINNSIIGTPDITGGTHDSAVFGTPAVTGGTIVMDNNVMYQSRDSGDTADVTTIGLNSSNQTVIGSNSVRATRYVQVSPSVNLVSVNPGDTTFQDVDVTANTSARCLAVCVTGQITSDSTARVLHTIMGGETQSLTENNRRIRGIASTYDVSSWVQNVDTGGTFQWAVNNANAGSVVIDLTGYLEYVD